MKRPHNKKAPNWTIVQFGNWTMVQFRVYFNPLQRLLFLLNAYLFLFFSSNLYFCTCVEVCYVSGKRFWIYFLSQQQPIPWPASHTPPLASSLSANWDSDGWLLCMLAQTAPLHIHLAVKWETREASLSLQWPMCQKKLQYVSAGHH